MPNINLNYKMVTDIKNNFFTNNRFIAAESLPAEGDFVKGDLIVNIGENANDEAMWLCVESGNPGVWEVVGAGAGGGSSKIVTLKSRVVVNEALSEVNIGVSGFNKATDTLIVFNNARFMVEGVDYEINDDSTKILAMNGNVWNEELTNDFVFDFVVFKMMNVNENGEVVVSSANEIVKLKNTVIVNEAVNEVEIGIDGFNEGDDLTVYRNSVYMIEGIDYEVQGNKIVSLKGAWNAEGGSDYKFTFEVLKTVAKINPDAVVGMGHLTEDVKEAIEAAGNIDLSGKQDKSDEGLVTTDKTIVGAINELFQNANNGKELIANAIGEPLDSNDTFSAMSTDINSLLSTFKTNMMNNGITVESSDRFKTLIDKIATMVEEGEGKGVKFAEGVYSLNKVLPTNTTITVPLNIEFTPTIMFVILNKYTVGASGYVIDNVLATSFGKFTAYTDGGLAHSILISGITKESFNLTTNCNQRPSDDTGNTQITWYAIGVGEEDTTLRDSLASILQEEGVSVTEEDDIASLITKVDEEFSDKENEISNLETELAGKVTPAGNAVASNVLTGKTFINSTGNTLTGTMANNGTKTITPKASTQTLGAGYYDKITINGDVDLVAANIVSGKNIFGVTGTATVASMGGKRTATGTITSSSNYCTVTNLGFRPSIVYCVCTTSNIYSFYLSLDGKVLSARAIGSTSWNDTTTQTTISDTGFSLYVGPYNTTFNWIAIE